MDIITGIMECTNNAHVHRKSYGNQLALWLKVQTRLSDQSRYLGKIWVSKNLNCNTSSHILVILLECINFVDF